MAKRHSDALAIQEGACNPIAIVKSLDRAITEIRGEPKSDTPTICNDPAIKLIVHQLAYLCGVITGAEELPKDPQYAACMAACSQAVWPTGPHPEVSNAIRDERVQASAQELPDTLDPEGVLRENGT